MLLEYELCECFSLDKIFNFQSDLSSTSSDSKQYSRVDEIAANHVCSVMNFLKYFIAFFCLRVTRNEQSFSYVDCELL